MKQDTFRHVNEKLAITLNWPHKSVCCGKLGACHSHMHCVNYQFEIISGARGQSAGVSEMAWSGPLVFHGTCNKANV